MEYDGTLIQSYRIYIKFAMKHVQNKPLAVTNGTLNKNMHVKYPFTII